MTTPVSLVDLKPEEFKKFLDSFDHVFSDCDGVIWYPDPLPRVGEFFDLMKKHGKTVNFVSNNSLRTPENCKKMFKDAKIENGHEKLTTPSIAIAEYLKAAKFDKKVFTVSCTESTKLLESYGFICKSGPQVPLEYYEDFIEYFEDDPEIGAVMFDGDYRGNLAKIYKACTYLKRPEVLFLAGATDKRLLLRKGISNISCGIFTEIVAKETKREPIILAKPSKIFGEFAMKRAGINCDPSKILFIGDMIEQDIGLGRAIGFQTLLVLSNHSKEAMMAHDTRPDYYAESLATIVPLLEV